MKLPFRFSLSEPKEFAVTLRRSRHFEVKRHPKTFCAPATEKRSWHCGGERPLKVSSTYMNIYISIWHKSPSRGRRRQAAGMARSAGCILMKADLLSRWRANKKKNPPTSPAQCVSVCRILHPLKSSLGFYLGRRTSVPPSAARSMTFPSNLIRSPRLLAFSGGDRRSARTSAAAEAASASAILQRLVTTPALT